MVSVTKLRQSNGSSCFGGLRIGKHKLLVVLSLTLVVLSVFQWRSVVLEFVFFPRELCVNATTEHSNRLGNGNNNYPVGGVLQLGLRQPPPTITNCGLWMAESTFGEGRVGIFAGVPRAAGELLAEPSLVIPILDMNKNEFRYVRVITHVSLLSNLLYAVFFVFNPW